MTSLNEERAGAVRFDDGLTTFLGLVLNSLFPVIYLSITVFFFFQLICWKEERFSSIPPLSAQFVCGVPCTYSPLQTFFTGQFDFYFVERGGENILTNIEYINKLCLPSLCSSPRKPGQKQNRNQSKTDSSQ